MVLGSERHQRIRASQALVALVIYLLCALVAWFGVAQRFIDPLEAAVVCATMISGALVFYALIRSGANLRLSSDPSLTLPQGVLSVLSTAAGYYIAGPVRGAELMILLVTLMFGMFALRPREVRGLSVFALLVLGLMMFWGARFRPDRFPASIELAHFMFAAILMPAFGLLSSQLSSMRQRLRQHKRELEAALEQIRQLATHDELTRLYNRRHMNALLGERRQTAAADAHTCVALLDIDHFKRINDRHGHANGDAVLMAFASSAQSALRTSDILCRWGGEEFLLLLPDTTVEAAHAVIERLRSRVAALRFEGFDAALVLTFSCGLAVWRADEPAHAAVERADAAMYRAKAQGRDRTALAEK